MCEEIKKNKKNMCEEIKKIKKNTCEEIINKNMCEEIFKNKKEEIEEFQECESEGRPLSVVDEINRGIHLKNQHKLLIDQNEHIDKIKPLYERKKKVCKKKPLKRGEIVWKIIYPKPDKYKPCKHFGVPTKDRDILSRTNYLKFLSQPKPVSNICIIESKSYILII